jgi:hypothetical protein
MNHDTFNKALDACVEYRRLLDEKTNEIAKLREEVDLLKAANSDVRRIADERNKAEKEIKEIRFALGDDGRRTHREILELATKASKWREWKEKYIDLRNAHIAEWQDPAGTIWEHADKLQKQLTEKTNQLARSREAYMQSVERDDFLTQENERLCKENNEFLLSEAVLAEELKISDDWLRHTRNEVARLRDKVESQAGRIRYLEGATNHACGTPLSKANQEVARLREALELIACPERPDGTYNRDRRACELLAKEALKAEIK